MRQLGLRGVVARAGLVGAAVLGASAAAAEPANCQGIMRAYKSAVAQNRIHMFRQDRIGAAGQAQPEVFDSHAARIDRDVFLAGGAKMPFEPGKFDVELGFLLLEIASQMSCTAAGNKTVGGRAAQLFRASEGSGSELTSMVAWIDGKTGLPMRMDLDLPDLIAGGGAAVNTNKAAAKPSANKRLRSSVAWLFGTPVRPIDGATPDPNVMRSLRAILDTN